MTGSAKLTMVFALGICCLGRGEVIDRIAVSVGNRVITASELDLEIRVSAFLNGEQPDLSPEAKRDAAVRLVEQKLIRRELENSADPVPKPAEAEPVLAKFRKERFKSDQEYRAALAAAGISEQDLKDAFLWQRTLLLFVARRFRPGIQVNGQEIQDYFDKVVAPAARQANPGREVTLEDFREQIEETLAARMVDEETSRWLVETRGRTAIVYRPEVFQ